MTYIDLGMWLRNSIEKIMFTAKSRNVTLCTIVGAPYSSLDNLLDELLKPHHMTWKQRTGTMIKARLRLVTLSITVRASERLLDGLLDDLLKPCHVSWKQCIMFTAKVRWVTLGAMVRASEGLLDSLLDSSIEDLLEDTYLFTSSSYQFLLLYPFISWLPSMSSIIHWALSYISARQLY